MAQFVMFEIQTVQMFAFPDLSFWQPLYLVTASIKFYQNIWQRNYINKKLLFL